MDRCFIHFGSTLLNTFGDVQFNSEIKICRQYGGKVFNVLRKRGKILPIDEVFMSWHYNIYLYDGKLSYGGIYENSHSISNFLQQSTKCKISHVSCGWKQVLIIAENKKCFFSEINDFSGMHVAKIRGRVPGIIAASTDDTHSVLLSDKGEVYMARFRGSMVYVDMMDTENEKVILSPIKLHCRISEVVCGKEHVLLLSSEGQVLSFGSSSRGQLGHGDTDPREKPTVIEALDGIKMKSVAAGGWHSSSISDIGDVYMWGWNESGQIALPSNSVQHQSGENTVALQSVPNVVSFEDDIPVSAVSCGSRHTAVLTEAGTVWTWGWNGYGQLAIDQKITSSDVPVSVTLPPEFTAQKISCAFWSTLISGVIQN